MFLREVVDTYSDNAKKFAELVGLGVVELLTQGAKNVLDLGEGDLAGAVLVEDLGWKRSKRNKLIGLGSYRFPFSIWTFNSLFFQKNTHTEYSRAFSKK